MIPKKVKPKTIEEYIEATPEEIRAREIKNGNLK
jgi:hypothetical protein